MNQQENIEKLFSEALSNYEAPVDPSAWQAVQSGLNAGAGTGVAGGDGGFWVNIVAKIPGGMTGLGAAVIGTGMIIGSVFYFNRTEIETEKDIPGTVTEVMDESSELVNGSPLNAEPSTVVPVTSENLRTKSNPEILGHTSAAEEKTHSEKSPANQALSANQKENNTGISSSAESPTAKTTITEVIDSQKQAEVFTQEDIPAPVMKILARIQANPIGGTAPLTVTFSNEAEGKTQRWDFGSGEGTKASGSVKYTFNKVGKHPVILYAAGQGGRIESDTVYIEVLPSSEISPVQNVFTPNNDGFNDVFMVQGKDLAHLKVNIFTASGKLVYMWEGMNGSWDGKLNNGEPAPAGPYYYVIQAVGTDSKKFKQNGTVNLIR